MTAKTTKFATIRTEGGLLPADLLAQVAAGSLPGMGAEADYHLVAREKLNEAISRSWNRLLAGWTAFQSARAKVAKGDPATTETRERWLLPLFSELGYGRLVGTRAIEIAGRTYPISHEWGHVPIHLVGAGIQLDQRTQGVVGAARVSPHGLVQELLNASPERQWGFVSNGLQLRLLRDSAAITRQAYLEFDLEDMMDGEAYSDFVVLWLVAHQSRLEGEPPEACWLEKWSQLAIEQGTRVLHRLRLGVEAAITALGRGFLVEPTNRELLERLRTGTLDRQGYYRQLLRLVYRLIFLMVAEDRDLLHPPGTQSVVRKIYADHYSIGRLRHLAERRRGSAHTDLFQALALVMDALGKDEGLAALGLPALGSFLWREEAVTDLARCRLRNRDLLEAVSALAFTADGQLRRAVDYRNLGSEELGSVYESLLELHPELNLAAGTFALMTAGGHERKLTGSYYTPTSLITSLLDSALTSVLEEAAGSPNPEAAILNLKVVDPACGSGHFLIAASHRIAKRLASSRTGDAEAAPEAVRRALRDVIGHCMYGVDMNDMAVELCKVSLWMEALEPGRPLSFLENRIVLGNSLLGATPALLTSGIPDAAFKPIQGDDPVVAKSWRRRNREEHGGQATLALDSHAAAIELIGERAADVDALPDDSLEGVKEKERRYSELLASQEADRARFAADAWCAAFVASKTGDSPVITEDLRRRGAGSKVAVDRAAGDEVAALVYSYAFLQWHLAFPDVFRDNLGFSVVLGNPPWDMIQLDDREFFAQRRPDIAEQPNMAARKRALDELSREDPPLFEEYLRALRHMEGVQHFIHDSGRFPLSSYGRLNTAPLFVELALSIVAPTGRCGLIVPTGVATDSFNQFLFQHLVDDQRLVSLYDFENRAGLFPSVDSRYKFCLLTLAGSGRPATAGAEVAFFAQSVSDLADEDRRFALTAADLRLMNPNTRTCPIFRTKRDADLVKAIYRRVPVLVDRSGTTDLTGRRWPVSFQLMFMMNTDSNRFKNRKELATLGAVLEGNVFRSGQAVYLPLYEGKMIHQFDHRFASFEGDGEGRDLTQEEKADPNRLALPRYWVLKEDVDAKLEGVSDAWMIAWRDITNTTNERTAIAALVPRYAVGNSAPLALALKPCVAACLNSFVVDFVVRTKAGGTHLNFYIVEQIPVLDPETFSGIAEWDPTLTVEDWIAPRLVELTCTATDMLPLAGALGFAGAPYPWNQARREQLRAELDAAFFLLYGLTREDAEYVLDTFPITRRKEERDQGEYRTKRFILERYDALAAAVRESTRYQTILDPPPPASRLPIA